jgi:predicted DNA-binding transcriptional regulator
MSRDRVVGLVLLVVSVVVIVAYAYVMFATPYALFLFELTGVVAIAVVFGILAWVGYALATTPPPKPIEEIEKEIEEELKKLEQQAQEQTTRVLVSRPPLLLTGKNQLTINNNTHRIVMLNRSVKTNNSH